jgi:electron transfer flavoprotein beta subunit
MRRPPPMTPAPLLCVCMKPVWRTDVPLRLDEAAHAPRPGEALRAANAADLAALQLALGLRAAEPALRVLALSVGPPAAEGLLREALAAGADEALRVWGADWPAGAAVDAAGDLTRAHAVAAARALRGRCGGAGAPALVLAGERSADTGQESFGAFLAAELGAAFAHRITAARRGWVGWRVMVRLERGYGQALELPAPAVATVSAQLPRPGEASLPAWLASRRAAIPVLSVDGPAPRAGATTLRVPVPRVKHHPVPGQGLDAEARIRAMVTLEAGQGGALLAGETPEAQAEAILTLLRERGYR